MFFQTISINTRFPDPFASQDRQFNVIHRALLFCQVSWRVIPSFLQLHYNIKAPLVIVPLEMFTGASPSPCTQRSSPAPHYAICARGPRKSVRLMPSLWRRSRGRGHRARDCWSAMWKFSVYVAISRKPLKTALHQAPWTCVGCFPSHYYTWSQDSAFLIIASTQADHVFALTECPVITPFTSTTSVLKDWFLAVETQMMPSNRNRVTLDFIWDDNSIVSFFQKWKTNIIDTPQ